GCVEVDNEGAPGAVVTDNRIQSDEGITGLQFQSVVDGRVERNTVFATTPAFAPAIHIDGGAHNVVANNVVTGPWFSALGLDDGNRTTLVRENRLEGATDASIALFTAEDDTLIANVVQCGDFCLAADASPRLVIVDNQFTSTGSTSGVHVQTGSDGTRIERNTI